MKRNQLLHPVMFVALLLSLMLTACGADTSGTSDSSFSNRVAQNESAPYPADYALEDSGGDTAADGESDDQGRMIIRTKVLRLDVGSTPDTVTAIREFTRTHSGSVSEMQVATDSDDWIYHRDEYGNPVGDGTALRGWVTVKVPSESYEDFVADVAGLGTIKYQSESTSDVTQEHVDLSARLENLRAQEARLRDFFDAAKDVKEMLAIEEELGRVRGDIESLDAQITYLERQAAMATVTIELTEPRAVVRPGGESWGFVDAITTGVRGAAGVLTWLLTALLATSPLWIAGVVLFFPIRAFVRRRARKSGAAAAPAPTPETAGTATGRDEPTT